jgi:hypothetical protein
MGNFNKYNDRSLSQLLAESAEILAEDEFPPGGASTEPPPAASDELPPTDDTGTDTGAPPEEEGAENTPEGIANQIRDLVDQLLSKLGVGGENADMTSSEIPGKNEEDIAAPAIPPPTESRKKPVAAKKLASAGTKS